MSYLGRKSIVQLELTLICLSLVWLTIRDYNARCARLLQLYTGSSYYFVVVLETGKSGGECSTNLVNVAALPSVDDTDIIIQNTIWKFMANPSYIALKVSW